MSQRNFMIYRSPMRVRHCVSAISLTFQFPFDSRSEPLETERLLNNDDEGDIKPNFWVIPIANYGKLVV